MNWIALVIDLQYILDLLNGGREAVSDVYHQKYWYWCIALMIDLQYIIDLLNGGREAVSDVHHQKYWYWYWCRTSNSIKPKYTALNHFILSSSILFYSILFCSFLSSSTLIYSVLSYRILSLFPSLPFSSLLLPSLLYCQALLHMSEITHDPLLLKKPMNELLVAGQRVDIKVHCTTLHFVIDMHFITFYRVVSCRIMP